MAAGDITITRGAWNTLTVTALQGLAASSTWVAGWESAVIDLTGFLDAEINVMLQAESTGLTAGEIRVYLIKERADDTYPDVIGDGTESAETWTDIEQRDSGAFLAAVTLTDATASRFYYPTIPSVKAVFGGNLPEKIVIFITHSMVAALESTGNPNTVIWRGSALNVAAS